MVPEGMETSVVMANLVGSENVPRELLWTAGPLLLVWSCEVTQILCPAWRGCTGKCLTVALRFSLLGLPAEPHLYTWRLPGAHKSRREQMWPGEGGGTG